GKEDEGDRQRSDEDLMQHDHRSNPHRNQGSEQAPTGSVRIPIRVPRLHLLALAQHPCDSGVGPEEPGWNELMILLVVWTDLVRIHAIASFYRRLSSAA